MENLTTRWLWRLAVVTSCVVAGLSLGSKIAAADCIGPTFSYTGGDLAHGDVVTVTGYGFGDNCYDTGPPPPGEGALGRPLVGIEVSFDQGGRRHLVAVGNADQDYAWEVQLAVPSVLEFGAAELVVVSNGFEAFPEDPTAIWVTSEREEGASIEVTTFGPVGRDEPEPIPQPAFRGTNWTPLFALGAAFMALAALLAVFARRSAN